MAFNKKRWVGTTGDYALGTNWLPFNVRNSNYTWTASGSGTNEYYLRTAASGNPGFTAKPTLVYINAANRIEGTVGSLTNLQWDYADNDALGYSTLYIRLDAGDPDSQADNYVYFYQVPVDADDVRIPAGSGAISSNLTSFAAVVLSSWYRERGHVNTIGSNNNPLVVNSDGPIEHWGTGVSYLQVTGDNTVKIYETASASEGNYGLYLTGTCSNALSCSAQGTSCIVGGAIQHGTTLALSAGAKVTGSARLDLGAGCTASDTLYLGSGTLVQRCNSTTTTVEGGTFRTEETCTITTLNFTMDGDFRNVNAVLNSSGTITTMNLKNRAAIVDRLQTSVAATITTLVHQAGTILYDDATTTITTYTKPANGPIRLEARSA